MKLKNIFWRERHAQHILDYILMYEGNEVSRSTAAIADYDRYRWGVRDVLEDRSHGISATLDHQTHHRSWRMSVWKETALIKTNVVMRTLCLYSWVVLFFCFHVKCKRNRNAIETNEYELCRHQARIDLGRRGCKKPGTSALGGASRGECVHTKLSQFCLYDLQGARTLLALGRFLSLKWDWYTPFMPA